MELWYWYSSDDIKPRGPFEIDHLKQLVRIGQLKHNDRVWNETLEDWIQASEIEYLFPPQRKGIIESAKNVFRKKAKRLTEFL